VEILFSNNSKASSANQQPLAERMRPRTINDVLGQDHILGDNSPLKKMLKEGFIPSIILWGPPGCGKTTLAYCISNEVNAEFVRLSAVESGVKELREIIQKAEYNLKSGKKTILFIDEIHRFNKAQQDALLHSVETGTLTLIGATTENPSFEVNPALISRMQVYHLQPLSEKNISELIENAIQKDKLLSNYTFEIENIKRFYELSAGDARVALNILENAFKLANKGENNTVNISEKIIQSAMQRKIVSYDKKGENHYDNISAFIKSLRGSDPDAAMLWMVKMLEAGEDPLFIARRMVIFASEDIGNAEPMALTVAVSVFQAVQIIGLPEAMINLANGVTFLASCAKSNASYLALEKTREIIKNSPNLSPPLYLRNAPTKLMKQEGYAKEYKYPHNFPNHFIEENYFPINFQPQQFYFPTSEGKESKIRERLKSLWNNIKKY
jgi:putative ATPase